MDNENIGRGLTTPIIIIESSGYFDNYFVIKKLYKPIKNGKRFKQGVLIYQSKLSKFIDRAYIKNGRYRKIKNFVKRMNKLRG